MFDNAGNYGSSPRSWTLALRMQFRVLAALILREMRAHFGEFRLGYLWAIIEPALHLAMFAFLFVVVLRRHSPMGGNLTLFMFTGVMPYFLLYKLSTYTAAAVEGNRALLNLPPVKPMDVFLSRGILEATTYIFVSFLVLLCMFVGGVTDVVPYYLIRVMGAVAGIVALGFGIGLINAVIRVYIRNWTTIFTLLLSPILLLSGIWFLPASVPPPFRDYLLYNPLMHYIMWVRSGFYRTYEPSELDRGYALAWSVLTLAMGLMLVRVCRRKLLEPA